MFLGEMCARFVPEGGGGAGRACASGLKRSVETGVVRFMMPRRDAGRISPEGPSGTPWEWAGKLHSNIQVWWGDDERDEALSGRNNLTG